jgi:hypothetical protein
LLDYDVTLLAKEKVMVEAIQTTASESYHNTVNNHDISPSGVDSQNRQAISKLDQTTHTPSTLERSLLTSTAIENFLTQQTSAESLGLSKNKS